MLPRLAVLVFVLASPTLKSAACDPEGRRPNIVLFLVDDMGWGDSGVYGSRYYETPNIDRLAGAGMRFTDAYSANPLCSPTRASILTGQYPARLGITAAAGALPPLPANAPRYTADVGRNRRLITPESLRYLKPEYYTLAEALHDAGYRTGHFGKWHLGLTEEYWPERQGYGVAFHGAPDPGPPGPHGYFSPYSFRAGTITPGVEGEYIVDRVTDEAIRFIDDNRGRPFFAAVWQFGVHGPWGHKEEYTRRFLDKQDPTGRQGNPVMASMLQSVDESLGRILDRLDELGLTSQTIVLFCSDNGGNVHSNTTADQEDRRNGASRSRLLESYRQFAGNQAPTNNAPLRDGKGTLYEGGIRIPLIVRYPDVVASGVQSSEIVSSIDFYPTLIELAGIERSDKAHFDGVSFAPTLRNPAVEIQRAALFNFFPHGGRRKPPGVTVRQGDWKLIRWFEPTLEGELLSLYNLKDDIGETKNLASEQPERVAALNAEIDRFLMDTSALVPKPNPDFAAQTGDDTNARPRRRSKASAATPE